MAAIEHIEARLGLTGQPRAIVFHVKAGTGREHCHVVWSRIDIARRRAVQLSHDYPKLRAAARELAAEFGLELPPGLAQEKGWDRPSEPPEMSMAEKAQAEQTGIAPEDRRADITAAYRGADSAAAFVQALEHRGYFLAIGNRRAFVVVDRYGHVHSLARQIDGVKTKVLKTFLKGLELRPLEEAKAVAARYNQAAEDRHRELVQQPLDEALHQLERTQAVRRDSLERYKQHLTARHAEEQDVLARAQQREQSRAVPRIFSAVLALLKRIPALRSVLSHISRNPRLSQPERHRLEREALERRHTREQRAAARHNRTLEQVENRERQALTRLLFRSVRARDHKLEMFAVNAHDMSAPSVKRSADERAQVLAPRPGDSPNSKNDETPPSEPDPLGPLIITSRPVAGHPAGQDDTVDEEAEDAAYEAQLDRLHYLQRWGLTAHFNSDALYNEMGWEHADPSFDPHEEDEDDDDPVDPIEAELDRLYALLRTGLTPIANASAAMENPYRGGQDRTFQVEMPDVQASENEALDPMEAEIAREHALLQYGLTPFFNESAGVPKKQSSEDDEGLEITDPTFQP